MGYLSHQQLRNSQGSLLAAFSSFLFLLKVSDEFCISGGWPFPRVRRPVPLAAGWELPQQGKVRRNPEGGLRSELVGWRNISSASFQAEGVWNHLPDCVPLSRASEVTFDWRYNQYVCCSFCYSSKSAAEAGVELYTVNPPETVLCAHRQSWNCERWDFIVYPCFHQATRPQEKKKYIYLGVRLALIQTLTVPPMNSAAFGKSFRTF